MGGEKFDSTHPEGYLFGENTDLNFLGIRPVAVGIRYPPLSAPGDGQWDTWGNEIGNVKGQFWYFEHCAPFLVYLGWRC